MIKNQNMGQKNVNMNGIKFDSQLECEFYKELKLLEKSGKVKNLKLQVPFVLQESYVNAEGKKIKEIKYIADFTYEENGQLVVADVKSKATKTQVYLLKKKLFEKKYKICIKEFTRD